MWEQKTHSEIVKCFSRVRQAACIVLFFVRHFIRMACDVEGTDWLTKCGACGQCRLHYMEIRIIVLFFVLRATDWTSERPKMVSLLKCSVRGVHVRSCTAKLVCKQIITWTVGHSLFSRGLWSLKFETRILCIQKVKIIGNIFQKQFIVRSKLRTTCWNIMIRNGCTRANGTHEIPNGMNALQPLNEYYYHLFWRRCDYAWPNIIVSNSGIPHSGFRLVKMNYFEYRVHETTHQVSIFTDGSANRAATMH